jgi:hypothetical protein
METLTAQQLIDLFKRIADENPNVDFNKVFINVKAGFNELNLDTNVLIKSYPHPLITLNAVDFQ